MKRKIITLGVIVLTLVAGLAFFSFSSAPEGPAEPGSGFVIVRATEVYGLNPSSLIVINEDGTVEKTPLNKLNAKNMEENLLIIHAKLNEISARGYELIFSTGGNSDNIICTNYIFRKK